MYFVGIDISKFKHDCAIVDEFGDVITPSWSFQNDREGFSLLEESFACHSLANGGGGAPLPFSPV